MEIAISFKAQGAPKNHIVSFSVQDVKLKDLGKLLSCLPEAIAKSYANTVAALDSDEKDVRPMAERLILRYCTDGIYQEGTQDSKPSPDLPQTRK